MSNKFRDIKLLQLIGETQSVYTVVSRIQKLKNQGDSLFNSIIIVTLFD